MSFAPIPILPLRDKPLVSVLMPNYNYAQYVEAAINSVCRQRWTHLELVVCDDGSTDDSCALIRRLEREDSRIRLIVQENAGVAVALNTAYAACRGDIVCLLDADDLFHEDKIDQMVAALRDAPQTGFVQHAMEVIDAAGNVLRKLPAHGRYESGWLGPALLKRGGRWRNMPASALGFRREITDLLFPLPANHLPSMADAYLYMLAPLLTEVAYLPEPLSSYRLHGSNLTGALDYDAERSRKFVEGMHRVHEGIRAVVAQRQLDVPLYEAGSHLTIREHRFMAQLFAGESLRALWPFFTSLAGAMQADDLYPVKRKLAGMAVFGSALLIPPRLRTRWVSKLMGIR